ncbi:MAG: autotransporter outer membrane beta-barrel domain-containing protein [Sutterella sp.]|nr:autotransporter outer membrane beta-barrel domain-containing protein [Sutterella sp.]
MLSLIASATLLALTDPAVAYSDTYVDRYATPFAVNNELAVTIDSEHRTDFRDETPSPSARRRVTREAENVDPDEEPDPADYPPDEVPDEGGDNGSSNGVEPKPEPITPEAPEPITPEAPEPTVPATSEPITLEPHEPAEPETTELNPGLAPEPTPEPQPDPILDVTDTAKGMVSTASVQYLAAMLPLETLRERLVDIHTFKPLDDKATPWVKLSGTEWRIKPSHTHDAWDVNFSHAKVGIDTRVGEKSLVGGYLAYSRFDTQHPAPAYVKGTGLEGGLYWTYLNENRTFSDLVLRVGRLESKFDTQDSRGKSVKGRDIDNTYWGLTWNVGRQIPLNQTIVLEPMALVGYTRFGSSHSVSSSGIRGETRSYHSLLTMLGSTVEGRFTTSSGKPWTVYGKLFWEKEWLANPSIVFNGHNAYRSDFKDHQWVYGLGVEGRLGKVST